MGGDAQQREVRSLEDKRFQAMVAGDAATLEGLLSDDLVYTHSNARLDTKASLIEAIRAKRSNYQRFERPQEEIRVFGDSAVITGQARIALGGDTPRTLNVRYTDVWVKRPGGWQMVAWQSTPIPA